MSPLGALAFIFIAAIFVLLVIYFWYIALVFIVVGLFSTLNEKYKKRGSIKMLFFALYFVALIAISSLFKSFGMASFPNISDSNNCANGYVCY